MPQTKINSFGLLTPTGVDNSGAEKLRALAGLTQQVSGIAFEKLAAKRQKEGALAGGESATRNEQGELNPLELESDNTIYGQAYNNRALLAHKAQAGMDAREDLDRLEEQHKLDPEAFKSSAQGALKGITANMPPELSQLLKGELEASISNRHSKLLKQSFKRESEQQRATALDSIESHQDDYLNAIRSGDSEQASEILNQSAIELNDWVESGIVSADEARKISEDTAERELEQNALREVDDIIFNDDLSLDEQLSKGSAFLDSLRGRELKDLSPEQKDSLINIVGSKLGDIKNRRAAEIMARDIEREKIVSNLKVEANLIEERAKNGEPIDLASIVERVEGLHNSGAIKGNERTSLLTHVAKANDDLNRITMTDKRILARQGGDSGVMLSQSDVDSNYKRVQLPIIERLPPEMQQIAKANYITQTRTVPSQVKQEITSQVLSGDVEQIQLASDLVDRIDDTPGMASLAVDANQRAFMNNLVMLSQSMEPEQAVKLAKELTDPRDKARIEEREQVIKTDKMRDDYAGKVENAFEGILGANFLQENVNKQQVESEYANLFESFFKAGDSKEAAEAQATKILQANWKESQFGFMKNRPEDYYSVKGNADYIKPQLIKDIKLGGIGMEFNDEDVFLLSDDRTSREASQGSPSYRLMVLDSNGEMQWPVFTDSNGRPSGRWSPDPSIEKERLLAERERQLKDKREGNRAVDIEGIF